MLKVQLYLSLWLSILSWILNLSINEMSIWKAYFLFKHSDMCKQIKDLHSLVYVTLLFMYLCITYVTHKDAILDVKVQVPCNGLLRSNFSEKEEATWIKIGEDYNFIQLGDWVYLALLYDLWSTIHRKQIDFYLIYLWPFWLQQRKRKKLKCFWKLFPTVFLSPPANTRFFVSCFVLLAKV